MRCDHCDSTTAEISRKTFMCYATIDAERCIKRCATLYRECSLKKNSMLRLVLSTQLNCPVSVWMVHFCLVYSKKLVGSSESCNMWSANGMPRRKSIRSKRICVIFGVNFQRPMDIDHKMVVQKKNNLTVIQISWINMCDGG